MTRWGKITAFILVLILSFGLMAGTYTNVVNGITLGLDLQGGFEILYKVKPMEEGQEITKDILLSTESALRKRIDVIGVTEPDLTVEGDDRIRVKLAGIKDPDEARRLLKTEANLTFRNVNDEVLLSGGDLEEGSAEVYLQDGRPVVSIEFKDADKAYQITREYVGQPIAIWMDFEEGVDSYEKEMQNPNREDSNMISAPMVNDPLYGQGVISSDVWSFEEAQELADLLNAGALPVELEELSANSVGAKLGEHAMSLTIFAGMIGGILIFLYMIFYYRLPGLVAGLSLFAYVYLILVVYWLMEATLTLPGIAALILGIGMAIDANIITNERIREEIRSGKTMLSSFKAGSRRALGTILDANITTIIAASVLFYFGSSAIQGFAVMLIVSILLSIITAVFGARFLLGLLVTSRAFDRKPRWFGVKESEISEL